MIFAHTMSKARMAPIAGFLALTAVYAAYIVAGFLARPDWGAAH